MSVGGEHPGRFLDSSDRTERAELSALGPAKEFVGLETFPNPGVGRVKMVTDEVTAKCPVTEQPDWYTVVIEYVPDEKCLESKSVKLYLQALRDQGAFVEALSVLVRDDVMGALELEEDKVQVTFVQKPRGGIEITAVA